jgi:hypothetical protein
MPGPRDYTKATVMMLAHLSGGMCYRPGCPEVVLRNVDGEAHVIVEIAHIHAAYPGGARYIERMSNDQRRHISNLLLLCDPDHDVVDKDEKLYPDTMLRRWKTQREANPREALQRLREVSPAGLRKIVAEGLKDHDEKLLSALGRLEGRDNEAAALMRSLIDELAEAYARQRQQTLDPDMVVLFSRSVAELSRQSSVLDAFSTAIRTYSRMPRESRVY